MYIRNLALLGFKSFVDETKLEFHSGFTAVVGPNGCGKSNISDALRWVLGEQSSKVLRSNKMEELIFNGSAGRKPLGMVEVSLTVNNLLKKNTTSPLSAYDQITITRRLFRSGESEYLMNKTPCRLKDILDFLLDHGITTRSFSIMDQAQVNNLINAKPEDRRSLIEEAAGVMKYKQRRNETLRKLHSAEENLLRLNDILTEIERQLNSLKRQARKAAGYKEKKEELRKLSLMQAARQFKEYNFLFREKEGEKQELRERVTFLSTRIVSLSSALEESKTGVTSLEQEVNSLRHRILEVENKIDREEEHISLFKGQINELIKDVGKKEVEIEGLKQSLSSIEREIKEHCRAEESIAAEISEKENLYASKNEKEERLKKLLLHKEGLAEGEEADLIDLLSKLAAEKNILTSLETRLDFLNGKAERLHKDQEKLKLHLEREIKQKIILLEKNLKQGREELQGEKNKQGSLGRELNELSEKLKKAVDEVSLVKDNLNSKVSLYNSLKELVSNYEGFAEGVRLILKDKEKELGLRGIRGTMVDFIETSPEYEIALEAALGERLQALVVENIPQGIRAIDYLKKEKNGRGIFIPLDFSFLPGLEKDKSADKEGNDFFPEGVIGYALNLLKYEDRYKPILKLFLGNILVVTNMEIALELLKQKIISPPLVTLSGELVERGGILIGGNSNTSMSGFFRRKRQIRELKREVKELELSLNSAQENYLLLKEICGGKEQEQKELEVHIHQKDLFVLNLEKDYSQLKEELEKGEESLQTFAYELTELDLEEEGLLQEQNASQERLEILIRKKEEKEIRVKKFREELKIEREALEKLNEEIREKEVLLTSLRSKRENLSQNHSRLLENKADFHNRIEKDMQESGKAKQKSEDLEVLLQNTKKKISDFYCQREEVKEQITVKEMGLSEKRIELRKQEEEINRWEKEKAGLISRISDENLKMTELNLELKHLSESIKKDYGLNLAENIKLYETESTSEELESKISYLREAIFKLGEVNLTALEEYENLKGRHGFLKNQQEDLLKSISSLKQTINKIDHETRDMFIHAFNLVNENFKNTFRKLFRGGKTELILTLPDNILETGVEIIAQPPGKKFHNINLLSQGEKALIALSLLFSVFMLKPTPFCLLDEVDAPLDEANILRFRDILLELSNRTQFIIITHNQKTMSFAQILYGITMEEEGVSRVVSVKLKKEQPLLTRIPAPLPVNRYPQ